MPATLELPEPPQVTERAMPSTAPFQAWAQDWMKAHDDYMARLRQTRFVFGSREDEVTVVGSLNKLCDWGNKLLELSGRADGLLKTQYPHEFRRISLGIRTLTAVRESLE